MRSMRRRVPSILLLSLVPGLTGVSAVTTPPPPSTGASAPIDVDARLQTGARAPTDAAVVVGIEDYAFLPDVPFAQRDAEAFYSYLVYTRGVPATRISLMAANPTAREIREAVQQAAATVGPDGVLWFYFAGHGAAHPSTGKRILLGVDIQGKVGSLEESAYTVAMDELDTMIQASPAAQAVVVVDSCYAGAGRDGKTLMEGKRFSVPAYASSPIPKTTHWFATSADEVSGPYNPVQHGLFTYFVVGALRGWADGEVDGKKDGSVTIGEAQQYFAGAVRTLSGGEQMPTQESRTELLTRSLTRAQRLETGPDLGEMAISQQRPKAEDKKPTIGEAVVSTGGDDYMSKLLELKRLREQREAAEAQDRTLLAAVQGERTARVDAARTKLLGEAATAWGQTATFLEMGGAEAVQAAQSFVDHYGTASITIDDYTESVKVPEVKKAQDWLARAAQAQAQAMANNLAPPQPAYVPPTPTPTPIAPAPASMNAYVFTPPTRDLESILQDLVPQYGIDFGRKGFAGHSAKKIAGDSSNDELMGDMADKALEKGMNDLAIKYYVMALVNDPADTEWSNKLSSLGVSPEVSLAVVESRLAGNPNSDEIVGDRGDALVALNRLSEACATYRRALELDSADSEWQRKSTETCGAMPAVSTANITTSGNATLQTLAQRDTTLAGLVGRLATEGTSDELWGDIGDQVATLGQADLALYCYLEAFSRDVGDSEWRRKIVALGGAAEMVSRAQATASAEPSNDERQGDLGDILGLAGRQSEACAAYARAHQLDTTDNEWINRVNECGGNVSAPSTPSSPVSTLTIRPPEDLYSRIDANNIRGIGGPMRAVRGDMQNDEMWGDLGDALAENNQSSLAEEAYLVAFSLQPSDSEWQNKLKTIASFTTLNAAFYTIVNNSSSPSDEVVGDWADVLAAEGRTSEACTQYQAAARIDSADSEWQRKLAELCGAATPGAPQPGPPVAQVAAPGSDDEIRARAKALLGQGNRAGAVEVYRAALGANPTSDEWQRRYLALSAGMNKGQLLQQLVTAAPNNDELIGDLGDYFVNNGQKSQAIDAYRRAYQIDQSDSEWGRKLATLLGNNSETAAMATTFKARAQNDGSDEVWGDYGDFLRVVGRWDEACEAWRTALRLDDDDNEWINKTGRCVSQTELRNLASASPNDDEIAGAMGYQTLGRGDRAGALSWFQKANTADPSDGEWIYQLLAQGTDTRVNLAQRAAQVTNSDERYGDYGDELLDLGRLTEAANAYRQALSLDPADSEWTWKVTIFP